jgi:hypothetical protein
MKIDIEKLRQLMRDLSREKGEFSFFGLFLREEAPDRWDLVVSSPWLEDSDLNTLREFAEKLRAAIGEEQLLFVSRIVTLDADEPALDAVTREISVEDGLVELRDADFFGHRMAQAYILRSRRIQEPAHAD